VNIIKIAVLERSRYEELVRARFEDPRIGD
jgi:hypothetical protein